MSAPVSPTKLLVCSNCGASLPVREEHIGRRCRCGRCGEIVTVVDPSTVTPPPPPVEPPAPVKVTFYCRVCDTRMVVSSKHSGRKAKCPDCGHVSVVPPPPKPIPKREPQAMHGQQYEVWGVDEAPSPADLSTRQPKFYPVHCRVCDTQMHAHARLIGKKLKCPDCGALTEVPLPPEAKAKKSVLVPDGSEYQIDTRFTPPVRPPSGELARAEAEIRARLNDKDPIRGERGPRPIPPTFPTLVGVLPMLLASPVPVWGIILSGFLTGAAVLLAFIGGGTHLLVGLLLMLPLSLCAIFFLLAASAIWLAILAESSEGNARLHHPPGIMFFDWMGDALFFVSAGLLAGALPWVVSTLLDASIEVKLVVQVVGWWICFPVLLLAELEQGSPLEPMSWRIFGTLVKRPHYWLLFYVQTALIGVALGAVEWGMNLASPYLFLLSPTLTVAASMLYFRLLGRLGWWLAESLPEKQTTP